jgi:hypothetical protein
LTRPTLTRWCGERDVRGLTGLRDYLAARLAKLGGRRPKRGASPDALRAALDWCVRLLELPAWLALEAGSSPHDLAEAIAQRFELDLALRPTASTWAVDVRETRRWMRRWVEEAQGIALPLPDALREVLDRCARDAGRSSARGPLGDGVRVMTLHASKGLEFRHVFLAGVNEGLLPLSSAWRDPDTLAEEKRLLFVGLTRARDSVEISWYRQPPRPDARPEPSSFLHHLPAEAVRWLHADDLAARSAPPVTGAPVAALRGEESAEGGAGEGWQVGQQARHRRYGVGTITEVTDAQVAVEFPGRGTKRFALSLCPLEPCGTANAGGAP